ncbi:Hypothetical protein GLP15_2884 [Giardia lamblia P15]|uniref:Uncharacterized protein n=1 Tax=Giardia intestinalis (strain P15) TaxID=658858 RepID=E1F8Z4_GIAIA|nr:Hypothetical protein GLP15_2884 [Giardia lamblia P15]
MYQAPCTRLDFFLLNKEQIMQWDVQRLHTPVRYLIPMPTKPGTETHSEHEIVCSTDANCNNNVPASPSSVCLAESSASTHPSSQQAGSIQPASTHSISSVASSLSTLVVDGYQGSTIRHFMSIAPYNESASHVNGQEIPWRLSTISKLNPVNSLNRGPPTGILHEYTYSIAQRFIDITGTSTSFAMLSGTNSSHTIQQFPAKVYMFKPISDAMHISNYDELLLDVSIDETSGTDNSGPAINQQSPEHDGVTLFQVTSPSVDVAISTNSVTPAFQDPVLDSLMLSAYGDPTLLDAHSAYEFSELMRHAEPVTTLNTTDLYTPKPEYTHDPYLVSPTTHHHWAHHRAFTTLTPTSFYMPKYLRSRTMNVPAEIQLKKRLFHGRRMIRIVASNQHIIGDGENDCTRTLFSSATGSSVEAYQVLPVGTQADDFMHQDAFIFYCKDGMQNGWEDQDLSQTNALSPLKTSLMSPLVPFALNVPGDIGYRSVRVNRETIQSPILKNSVLAATPKVVILPENGTNTHGRRFLVTPIHSSTPRNDSGSGFKSLNYHALSSNETSSEKGLSDVISDQSYDSLFIDTRKQVKLAGASTATPYNFSLECTRKDLRDIPLPPTLKKN